MGKKTPFKRKIATNIPDDVLKEATALSGLTQTGAILAGLKELIRTYKTKRLIDSEGTFSFDSDPSSRRNRGR